MRHGRPPKRDESFFDKEYYTALNFCYCYEGWKMRLRVKIATIQKLMEHETHVSAVKYDGMPKGTNIGDPTEREAGRYVDYIADMRRDIADLKRKISIIEDAVSAVCDETLRPYLLESVTIDGATFSYLQAKGMPLSKNEHSALRVSILRRVASSL